MAHTVIHGSRSGATCPTASSNSAVWYKWSSTDTTWRRARPSDRCQDMRTTLPPDGSRRVRLLYAGVAVFVLLAALTARSVWRAWNERAGQARAAAVFDLVRQRMPSRPTEAPGAMAW